MALSRATRIRLLTLVLRLGGICTAAAFLAVFLPTDWMATAHEFLGLGPFPGSPLVDYLTRSIALLYGFHGVLMLIVAGDPVRYRTIVKYIGIMDILFGIAIAAIDLHAGMPLFWTIGESGAIMAVGIVITALGAYDHE